MPKLLSKTTMIIALTVLLAAQFALLGVLWHRQTDANTRYQGEIDSLQQSIIAAGNGLAYQPVTVAPAEHKIYLPQLSLSLPLTPLGTSLVYSPDTAYVTGSHKLPSGPLDEASVSTFTTASAPQSQRQFDCSSLVRIKFEATPNPYNPNELPSGSVKLANGKTLQIYAYHLKNCRQEWMLTQANADAVAALFKQAQSY